MAILENIDRDLSERGVTDKRGKARSILNHRSRISRELDQSLARIAPAMERRAAAERAESGADRARADAGEAANNSGLGRAMPVWAVEVASSKRVGPVEVLREALLATKANGVPDWAARISAARTLATLLPEEIKPADETSPEPTIVV